MDKKTQSTKAVGWFCLGFAILTELLALFLIVREKREGMMLLVVGLGLLTVGMMVLASAKKSA